MSFYSNYMVSKKTEPCIKYAKYKISVNNANSIWPSAYGFFTHSVQFLLQNSHYLKKKKCQFYKCGRKQI